MAFIRHRHGVMPRERIAPCHIADYYVDAEAVVCRVPDYRPRGDAQRSVEFAILLFAFRCCHCHFLRCFAFSFDTLPATIRHSDAAARSLSASATFSRYVMPVFVFLFAFR